VFHRDGRAGTILDQWARAKAVENLVILLDIEKVLTMTEGVRAPEAAGAAVSH